MQKIQLKKAKVKIQAFVKEKNAILKCHFHYERGLAESCPVLLSTELCEMQIKSTAHSKCFLLCVHTCDSRNVIYCRTVVVLW